MKTLITFLYYERNSEKVQDNLKFFLKHGVIENDDYHYNFILNGHECSVEIPQSKNLSVIRRENTGWDFGGYTASLESVDINEYDNFIFINDTMRGPFTPRYIPPKITWVDMFLAKLDDKMMLVGSFLNFGKSPHIQSCAFATNKKGLQILIDKKIFFGDYVTKGWKAKRRFVSKYETRMSQIFLGNPPHEPGCGEIFGFNLSAWKRGRRLYEPKQYFNDTINPLEVMFIKTTRINNQTVKNYTKWLGLD
tara:strand:- start:1003 stop:1752 length:750 start_codon:yes stop_codon:yes gene_type:complete